MKSSSNFSGWRLHQIFTTRDLQFTKPYHIVKSETYGTLYSYIYYSIIDSPCNGGTRKQLKFMVLFGALELFNY